jgi:hypothetical protein
MKPHEPKNRDIIPNYQKGKLGQFTGGQVYQHLLKKNVIIKHIEKKKHKNHVSRTQSNEPAKTYCAIEIFTH